MPTTPNPPYELVVGLEVHAELQTRSKMFCGCPVVDSPGADPNSAVCEVCTGMPGTLPVINERAVEFALRAALALHGQVAPRSLFARKNYFYPDLPKGFQISQYEMPLSTGGWLEIDAPEGSRRVAIRRVHLEEDTGKLFHQAGSSLVDFNRSGVPLLEVVSEPELFSIEEVKAYATALRTLLRYIGITSGDMEKGAIRFEANISLRPAGTQALGTRTEIKNLNSFRSMLRALAYEIDRQSALLASGASVAQETLRWNDTRGETYPERGKEEANDYRYFPEPDLPALVIDPAWVERIAAALPELPWDRRTRFVTDFGLPPQVAGVLTAERETADFFEAVLAAAPGISPEKAAHWVTGEVFSLIHQAGIEIQSGRLTPGSLAQIMRLTEQGGLTLASAKEVLADVFRTGEEPAALVERRGLSQLNDREAIEKLVEEVIAAHPSQVEQYRAGKSAILEWLFGQVMRAAAGRANPSLIRTALQARLQASEENRTPR
jgi:aspartyl-tRNA(Asn)/glutamyl-tRNA(Gln) amidotransferase subunit B